MERSGRREVKVWDARTGTPLLELKGHTTRGEQRGVQPGRHADRHRQRALCDGRRPEAKVWDARTGTLLLELKGHTVHGD